jgi:hypothetical protein
MNNEAKANSDPKTWDLFLYSGEKRLLMVRLQLLWDFVDYFVIVESKYTFSGSERAIDYKFRSTLLEKYGTKVRWIILEEFKAGTAWQREAFCRQSLVLGLNDLNIGDLIILSDLDELPNSSFISSLSEVDNNQIYLAKVNLFRYCPHLLSSEETWCGPIGFRFDGSQLDLQSLRMRSIERHQKYEYTVINDAGVHCSSFLSIFDIKNKIKGFSHTELNTFPFNSYFFVYLLAKLGVSFDGREVLKLSNKLDHTPFRIFCTSNHRFDRLRLFAAFKFALVVEFVFNQKVTKLSSPMQETIVN